MMLVTSRSGSTPVLKISDPSQGGLPRELFNMEDSKVRFYLSFSRIP